MVTKPFQKVSSPKGKNLLPPGANSFLLEFTPLEKGGKREIDRVAVLDMYPFILIISLQISAMSYPTLVNEKVQQKCFINLHWLNINIVDSYQGLVV